MLDHLDYLNLKRCHKNSIFAVVRDGEEHISWVCPWPPLGVFGGG